MAMRINANQPGTKEKQQRAAKLPTYSTKDDATKAAVRDLKADDQKILEVWKAPDGKFVVAPYQVWEDLYQLGYNRAVKSTTVYDIAVGRVDMIEEV